MEKSEWVIDAVKKLERVYGAKCGQCGAQFIYTVTTADTDMVPIYCGSAYDPKNKVLVVAERTSDEYQYGCEGRLPERMEQIFGGHFVYLNYKSKCPLCGGDLKERRTVPWDVYLSGREKAFIVFYDEGYQQNVKKYYKSFLI